MADLKLVDPIKDKSPARFLRKGLDDGRYGPKETVRSRLNSIRDIFYPEQKPGQQQSQIALANGGCFHPPPIEVLKKFINTALHNQNHALQIYPENNALDIFLHSIWTYFFETCEIPLNEEEHGIVFGNGSSHLFDLFLSCVADTNDVVLMVEPFYHGFSEWPAKWGAEAHSLKTQKKHAYKLVAKDVENWCLSHPELINRVSCLVITNPTCTGAIYTKQEINDLVNVIKKYDFLVFSDEVYRDSVFSGERMISLASNPELSDRIVTASSGSKSKNVAEARVGWACGPKEITNRMIWHMEHSFVGLPIYLQEIGNEILSVGKEYLHQERQESLARVELIKNLINHSNLRLETIFSEVDNKIINFVNIPRAGNVFALDFTSIKGWKTPEGKLIQNSEDLCRYFYYHHHKTESGDLQHGVCFSCGHSKGHDDLILYVSFAQPGYEHANEAALPYYQYELARHTLKQVANDQITDNQIKTALEVIGLSQPDIPDYTNAQIAGRQIIADAFDRVVCALKLLTPPSATA